MSVHADCRGETPQLATLARCERLCTFNIPATTPTMKLMPALLFLFVSLNIIGQTSSPSEIKERLIDLHDVWDTNYVSYPELKTILKDAEIVMLGEQTHSDGTTFATKIKLIEFLHREMDFDILAFESGFYDCKKAWEEIEKGARVDSALASSVFGLWSETQSFISLTEYISNELKSEHPLQIAGFDNQFTGKTATTHYIKDLKNYLAKADTGFFQTEDWKHFENTLSLLLNFDYKGLKKNDSDRDIAYVPNLIGRIEQYPQSGERSFWIRMMHNTKAKLTGTSRDRDFEMAENLFWLKENNPGKKIICWGATSHFLYNSQLTEFTEKKVRKAADEYYQENPSMGNYVKDKYGDKLYTVGFIAHDGTYYFGSKKIESSKPNSLEGLLSTSDYNNCFLPLEGLIISPIESRPLSYQYMTTDIAEVMDGVIFNRKMVPTRGNYDLIYELHPEYKWSQKQKKKLEKEARKKNTTEEKYPDEIKNKP